MAFLGSLLLILITTTIIAHFSTRIGIPGVIGQLLVGILLGPALLNWLQPNNFIHIFSELGVIILMFMAGLESNLALLKKYFGPSVLVAILGVIFPVAGTMAVGELFGIHGQENIFIGVIFAATSVSISVAVLKELDLLKGQAGSTILGAAVVDDILAVLMLSVMVSLLGTGGSQQSLGLTFVWQVLYFVGVYLLVKFVTPYLVGIADKLFVPQARTLMAIILCFSLAYVADLAGLSAVVGAFFAGIAIDQTKAKTEVDHNIQPIGYGIFIPVFFVSIGLNMTLAGLREDIGLIIVLTVVATLMKLIGAALGAKFAHFDNRQAYLVGAGMVSRGEMALIIAQIGFEAKLLSTDYYSAIVTAIILTTLIAPFLIKLGVSKHNAKSLK
ncbi:Na(+)/H(+) antiporter [Agrilactobacillus composti DSM 18527 = JCM 14202]|nr:cation:proton antiporter [Agrilactobacillus composti]GAF40038.1 Na(+)/H(+) antiporter [Agrilactobacillus composti DSM 18527 = JCM 14202]